MEAVLTPKYPPARLQILTQWFDPEPAFKGISFARELAKRGFDVEVVTGFPNYPTGIVYSGYRLKLCQREVVDGISIVRLPLFPSHDSSVLRRILNYISFALSVGVYGLIEMRKADVMYVYHPPLTVGLSAALIRAVRRIPIVYDVQDLWPDTLSATGMLRNRTALNVVGFFCKMVYRSVDRIAVLSEGFKAALLARGVPESKVVVVRNWADEAVLRRSPPTKRLDIGDKVASADALPFTVVYAGNLGKAQALDAVLDAALMLRGSERPIRFLFVGDGIDRPRLKAIVRDKGIDNVRFEDPVPLSEIGAILSRADALLVHLSADPLFDITIPSKTQAYLCIGRPVVMAVGGEAADLVERAGAGVVAQPGDAESISNAVLSLARLSVGERISMGERGRRFYESELSFDRGVDAFAALCRDLCSK
jgi:colanic acid biosynthesis glycosyl transferase WcaI